MRPMLSCAISWHFQHTTQQQEWGTHHTATAVSRVEPPTCMCYPQTSTPKG